MNVRFRGGVGVGFWKRDKGLHSLCRFEAQGPMVCVKKKKKKKPSFKKVDLQWMEDARYFGQGQGQGQLSNKSHTWLVFEPVGGTITPALLTRTSRRLSLEVKSAADLGIVGRSARSR